MRYEREIEERRGRDREKEKRRWVGG